MKPDSQKDFQSPSIQTQTSTNKLQQQLDKIYQKHFKPNTNSVNNQLPFEQIDHGPVQLCKQFFSIQQNCLIINFDAFDRYYPYLFDVLKVRDNKSSIEQQQKKLQQQEQIKQNDKDIKQLLQAADIILAFNGENDRAWNIKKLYLQKKIINKGEQQQQQQQQQKQQQQQQGFLNLQWQLRFNSAVCLKNKKSSSYYQYRLVLINKQVVELIQKYNQQSLLNNQQQQEKSQQIQQKQEQQSLTQLIQKIKQILKRQHELINRVLGRYFRNYFCWMYRIKLIQMITNLITQQIYNQQPQQILQNQQPQQILQNTVLEIEHKGIHKFIQKYCNDYSAYSYLIAFMNRYLLTSHTLRQQHLVRLNSQLQWVKQLQQYCVIAYSQQQQHYRHLIMYKNHIQSLKNRLQLQQQKRLKIIID